MTTAGVGAQWRTHCVLGGPTSAANAAASAAAAATSGWPERSNRATQKDAVVAGGLIKVR